MIGRLVENQNTRVHHCDRCESHPRLLASGQGHDRLGGQIAADAELAQECSILFGRLTRVFRLQKLDGVLIQIQLIHVVLTEVADLQISVRISQALARLQGAEQQFEQCGFAWNERNI